MSRSVLEKGVYDAEILDLYSEEEYNKLQSFIDHSRDISLLMLDYDK